MSRESILDVLKRGEVVIADGAFGTMLQAQGLPPGTLPEVWNAEHPDAVLAVHNAYFAAGAQVMTANTLGGNRFRMVEAGLQDCLAELNRQGIALARQAAGDQAWVAADIGPTGKLLEPYGDLSIADAETAYAEQIEIVAEAGADLILMETYIDIEEACCAIRAAKSHCRLPVFCSFAFNTKGRTMMGGRAADAARRAEEAGADAVGANCGEGPQAILSALTAMKDATTLPLIAQSNAGIPQLGEGSKTVWDVTSEQMAEYAHQFVALGARLVGGCCGTNPQFIAAIVAALKG